jgi:hypothetical protein
MLIRNSILETLKKDGISIIQNAYGNYLVQHLFMVKYLLLTLSSFGELKSVALLSKSLKTT